MIANTSTKLTLKIIRQPCSEHFGYLRQFNCIFFRKKVICRVNNSNFDLCHCVQAIFVVIWVLWLLGCNLWISLNQWSNWITPLKRALFSSKLNSCNLVSLSPLNKQSNQFLAFIHSAASHNCHCHFWWSWKSSVVYCLRSRFHLI